jgi:hypothetical protein
VIGALTFLTLVEGYVLTGGAVPSLPVIAVLAPLVGVFAATAGHLAERHLLDRNG